MPGTWHWNLAININEMAPAMADFKKNQERFAVFREKHKKGGNFKEKKGELRGVIKYNRVFLHEYVRLVLNINLIPDTQQISL